MIASVTRLRVRRAWHLPMFLWRTFRVQRQARHAAGFHGGKLLIDRHRTFWTLTVWEDERAMKQFRGAGAHGRVMSRLPQWCDEAAYAHWISANHSIPEWNEAYERLVSDGKLSRVERATPDHEARRFAKPRLQPLIEQDLKPLKAR